jgi:hypothetical protein
VGSDGLADVDGLTGKVAVYPTVNGKPISLGNVNPTQVIGRNAGEELEAQEYPTRAIIIPEYGCVDRPSKQGIGLGICRHGEGCTGGSGVDAPIPHAVLPRRTGLLAG